MALRSRPTKAAPVGPRPRLRGKKVRRSKRDKTSLARWCRRQGYGGITRACIRAASKSNRPTIRRQASFYKAAKKFGRGNA